MGGANPIPNAAQVRELRRLLVSEAPPSLAGTVRRYGSFGRAVQTAGSTCVCVSRVWRNSGAVAGEARKRIIALFGLATGGIDGEGWALGENPTGVRYRRRSC